MCCPVKSGLSKFWALPLFTRYSLNFAWVCQCLTERPTRQTETHTSRTIKTICEALLEPSSLPERGLLLVLLLPSLSVVVELESSVVELLPIQAKSHRSDFKYQNCTSPIYHFCTFGPMNGCCKPRYLVKICFLPFLKFCCLFLTRCLLVRISFL